MWEEKAVFFVELPDYFAWLLVAFTPMVFCLIEWFLECELSFYDGIAFMNEKRMASLGNQEPFRYVLELNYLSSSFFFLAQIMPLFS